MRQLLIALLAVTFSSCSSISVTADYDPNENFSVFRTYTWLPNPPPATGNPRLDTPMYHQRVQDAVDSVLTQKGFRKVSRDPDFWITFYQSVEQKLDVHTMNSHYTGRYGWRMSVPETRVTEYEQGTIVIDIADAKQKALVWRGVGKGRVRKNPPGPEQQRADFLQAASQILADFPPR